MNNKVIIPILVVVVALAAVAYYFGRQTAPAQAPVFSDSQASSTGDVATTSSSTLQNGQVSPSSVSSKPTPPTKTTPPSSPSLVRGIVIISPSQDDIWAGGSPKRVEWTSASGAIGSAYLTDAATGKTLGWLIASIEPGQTHFSWDPRYVYETKTGSNAVTVNPGLYKIHLVPGAGRAEIVSSVFAVAAAGSAERTTSVVRITNKKPDPAILQTPAGSTVYIVNNDPTSITLLSAVFSAAQITLTSGQAVRINTGASDKGKFYSVFSPVLPYQDYIRLVLQ